MHYRAPKLLPWLARRSGVSDQLADRLWRRSAQEATAIADASDSADYHAIALDRLLNLLEVEANGTADFEPSRHAWMWRHTERMARCTSIATLSISRIWAHAAQNLARWCPCC